MVEHPLIARVYFVTPASGAGYPNLVSQVVSRHIHWLSHQRPCLFFVCPPSANSPIIIRCSSSSASASIHFIHPLHPSIHSNQPQAAIRSTPTNQPSTISINPPATWCAKERASEWATRVTRNGTVTTVLAYHLPLPPSYIPKPHASTIPVSYTHIHHPTLESIKQLHSIITNVNHHQPSSINQQPSFVQHSPINYHSSAFNSPATWCAKEMRNKYNC